MGVFTKIEKNKYADSLETLYMTSVLNSLDGIEMGFAGMAKASMLSDLKKNGMLTDEISSLKESDFIIAVKCASQEVFNKAMKALEEEMEKSKQDKEESYRDTLDAIKACPEANMCSIAVPGEYALAETTKALNAGLHCVVFSNNVPLDDERKMKELAVEKGLLCMGPDCGVANIDGLALVLASITNSGPFGICGASGTGIQHVASILHECGSGISQAIGTGGNDLKAPVGGLMMQMGIDVLEQDPQTKYIILISRKPADSVLPVILDKVSKCKKPVVVYFIGCEREPIEKAGGIYAATLDDCGIKALELVGKKFSIETAQEIHEMALDAVKGMASSQKYVRGMYAGGTYMDEAMRIMESNLGPIWSNAPFDEAYRLENSYVSKGNCCVDYGEEEFTLGRPHPAIDPGARKAEILREASDPETAVIVLDFILTPPGHPDPAGDIVPEVKKAMAKAESEGRKLAVIGCVLGTDADIQNKALQIEKLKKAGVYVCRTNCSASLLACEIVRLQGGK